jgi:hypothetical protein
MRTRFLWPDSGRKTGDHDLVIALENPERIEEDLLLFQICHVKSRPLCQVLYLTQLIFNFGRNFLFFYFSPFFGGSWTRCPFLSIRYFTNKVFYVRHWVLSGGAAKSSSVRWRVENGILKFVTKRSLIVLSSLRNQFITPPPSISTNKKNYVP